MGRESGDSWKKELESIFLYPAPFLFMPVTQAIIPMTVFLYLILINTEFYDIISQFSPEVSNNIASQTPVKIYSTVQVFSTPFLVF